MAKDETTGPNDLPNDRAWIGVLAVAIICSITLSGLTMLFPAPLPGEPVFLTSARVDIQPQLSVTVHTIGVGLGPEYVTYDNGNDYVYVTNFGSTGAVPITNVSVINGTTVIATANTTPPYPGEMAFPGLPAYASATGFITVPEEGCFCASVIHGTQVVASVGVGVDPVSAVYDSRGGYTYVVNNGATASGFLGTVSVLVGTEVNTTINVGTDPYYAAYDNGTGDIYVPNSGSNNVSVISGLTLVGSVNVGGGPQFATYDDENGYVYVTNYDSGSGDSISVIDGTTVVGTVAVGSGPSSSVFDPWNGYIYVSNGNSHTVSVLNGTRVVGTLNVGQGPGYAAVDSSNGYVYVPNYGSDNVSVIDGRTLLGTISVGTGPIDAAYDAETGGVYVANYRSNNVSAIFVTPVVYAVTAMESGLPSGTGWWVNVTGGPSTFSDAPSLSFNVPNGTFAYAVASDDKSYGSHGGSFTVDGGTVSITVAFTRPAFIVAFGESGLPVGTTWSVTLNGTGHTSNSTRVSFSEPNGSFSYSVGSVSGYTSSPASGDVNVSGRNLSVPIAFKPTTGGLVPLTFDASGLPAGANWSVTLTATAPGHTIAALATVTRWSGGASSVTFEVSEGNYTYTASTLPNPGYGAYSAGPGSVKVSGPGETVTLTFRPGPGPPNQAAPLGWAWAVGLALLVIGLVGLAGTAYWRERRENAYGRLLVAQISRTDWKPDEEGEPRIRRNR
jgi:YVTN family beta-propeller protein